MVAAAGPPPRGVPPTNDSRDKIYISPTLSKERKRQLMTPTAQGWGLRKEGKRFFREGEVPITPKKPEYMLTRPMGRSFGDMLDDGMVSLDYIAEKEREAEVAVSKEEKKRLQVLDEIFDEELVLIQKGIKKPRDRKEEKQFERKMKESAEPKDRPQFFPHYRKAHDWEQQIDGEESKEMSTAVKSSGSKSRPDQKEEASQTFFSRKTWSEVYGMTSDVADLARRLELPRPSRIQNKTYFDLVKGVHTVLADQAGSGKTLAYLLPLLKRYIFGGDGMPEKIEEPSLRILILAPTMDLTEQIVRVATVVASRCGNAFTIGADHSGYPGWRMRQLLKTGVNIIVTTPGRFKWSLEMDPEKYFESEYIEKLGAVVFDEVDVLVEGDTSVDLEAMAERFPKTTQWVFATATMGQAARERLKDFEKILLMFAELIPKPKVKVKAEQGVRIPPKGVVWHRGPGLHKVSADCEHVLVDCTPEKLLNLEPRVKRKAIITEKIAALAWHLRNGVLREDQDDRIVVFCNTIDNCREIENGLRKLDSTDRKSGRRRWNPMVLHGERTAEDYKSIMDVFNSERVKGADFFKKRILICVDRLSRGFDFSSQPVNWVVLFDWPRDATEYLRRAGRTARGGNGGGILSLVAGFYEVKAAKIIMAAAIRGLALQRAVKGEGMPETLQSKAFCIERFNPLYWDWRAPEAAAPRKTGKEKRQAQAKDEELWDEALGADQVPKWKVGAQELGDELPDEDAWFDPEPTVDVRKAAAIAAHKAAKSPSTWEAEDDWKPLAEPKRRPKPVEEDLALEPVTTVGISLYD